MTMSGVPLVLHHCCGELEGISITNNHLDECCQDAPFQLSIDAPNCCEDEIIETAINFEGMPNNVSLFIAAHFIGLLGILNEVMLHQVVSEFHLASFLSFPSTSSIFLNREDLCIFII